jgi:hypothetical protein
MVESEGRHDVGKLGFENVEGEWSFRALKAVAVFMRGVAQSLCASVSSPSSPDFL